MTHERWRELVKKANENRRNGIFWSVEYRGGPKNGTTGKVYDDEPVAFTHVIHRESWGPGHVPIETEHSRSSGRFLYEPIEIDRANRCVVYRFKEDN